MNTTNGFAYGLASKRLEYTLIKQLACIHDYILHSACIDELLSAKY